MYCLVPEKSLRLAPQGHFLRGVYETFYLAPQGHFLRAPSVIFFFDIIKIDSLSEQNLTVYKIIKLKETCFILKSQE